MDGTTEIGAKYNIIIIILYVWIVELYLSNTL